MAARDAMRTVLDKFGPHDPGAPRVLLVSTTGRWAGAVRLPYLLRRAGVRAVAFAPAGKPLGVSCHLERFVAAPPRSADFATALRAHLDDHRGAYARALLCDEPTLQCLGGTADRGWLRGVWPIDPLRDGWDLCLRKAALVERAAAAGIPMPRSHVCLTPADAAAAANDAGYPCFVKANYGCAGQGVRRVDGPADLAAAWAQFRPFGPVVVQRLVAGRVGSAQVAYLDGRPLYWASSFKAVSWPDKTGPSCVREFFEHPAVDAAVVSLGRLTGFTGLCGFDWMRGDADGSVVVIEFNARPTPNLELVQWAGIDVPRGLAALVGLRPYELQRPRPPARFRRHVYLFPQHPSRCIGAGEWAELCRWLPGAATHDVPLHEPLIMANYVRQLVGQVAQRAAGVARAVAARLQRRGRPARVPSPATATLSAVAPVGAPAGAGLR